jgi:hypothetical protein
MIVYLEPPHGEAREYLERAKGEMERVLGFRGTVAGVKAEGNRIVVKVEINPKWDLPDEEKPKHLAEWIKAKTRKVFTVRSISERG